MWRWLLPWILVLAACPPPRPGAGEPCSPAGTRRRLASAERDLAEGYLHRALAAARRLAPCGERATGRLEARVLAELGLDAEASVAWRAWAAAPGATAADRAAAAAAVAELAKRPPAERAASAAEQSTAMALYRDGVNLRLQKDHAGALRQLRRSYALWPHPLTIVQIGAAHRAAGDERAAHMASERALAIAESTRRTRAIPRVATGNIGYVEHIAFAADGRRLMSGDGAGKLRVWDVASGRQVLTIDARDPDSPEPDELAGEVAFSPDGAAAATVSPRGRVQVWSLDSGRPFAELARDAGRAPIAFVRDRVAVGLETGVALYPMTGGAPTVLGGPRYARELATDAEGRVLAASAGGKVFVWDLRGSGPPVELQTPAGVAGHVAIAPGGDRLAVAMNQEIGLIDWRAGGTFETIKLNSWVNQIAFGSTGLLAATVGLERIGVWDGTRQVAALDIESREVSGFAWSPDGAHLVASSDDWSLDLWEVATGRCIRRIAGLATMPVRIALTPDGRTLISGDIAGQVMLRDLATGAVVRTWQAHQNAVLGLAMSPTGRMLATGAVATDRRTAELNLWDLSGAKLASTAADIELLAFSRDGRRLYAGRTALASGGDRGVWDLSGGTPLRLAAESDALTGHEPVATSSTEDLAAAGDDDAISLLSTKGPPATPVLLRREGSADIHTLAFGAGGRLAAAGEDGSVHLWDARSHRHLRELPGGGPMPLAAAWSPDGRWLAMTHFDGRISLYDVPAGRLRRMAAHESIALGVLFTPAGRLLTASVDGTVRLWNPHRGELLATLVAGADGRWLVIAPDGRVDGSSGEEGGSTLLYWQVGDVQLPGFVAWSRQHAPGLLRQLTTRPRESR